MIEIDVHELHELVMNGLVKVKNYPERNLQVFKYSRQVFYKGLWYVSPMLEEARGLVLNSYGIVIMRPFQKVYNYLENGAGDDVDGSTIVRVVEKVNGFMAQATRHKGELLVGTTGTLDSDYAKLAREVIENTKAPNDPYGREVKFTPNPNFTYLFEICDPSDTHIVHEEPGAYLIGIRDNQTGGMVCEQHLDEAAAIWGFKRPKHFTISFDGAIDLRKTCRHEGYMVQHMDGRVICKMKSHYYLVKKALMRMGKNRTELMFNNTAEFKRQIDEEFYDLVEAIVVNYNAEEWMTFDQERRAGIFLDFFQGTDNG